MSDACPRIKKIPGRYIGRGRGIKICRHCDRWKWRRTNIQHVGCVVCAGRHVCWELEGRDSSRLFAIMWVGARSPCSCKSIGLSAYVTKQERREWEWAIPCSAILVKKCCWKNCKSLFEIAFLVRNSNEVSYRGKKKCVRCSSLNIKRQRYTAKHQQRWSCLQCYRTDLWQGRSIHHIQQNKHTNLSSMSLHGRNALILLLVNFPVVAVSLMICSVLVVYCLKRYPISFTLRTVRVSQALPTC
jgi:hypothetical protein